MVPPPLTFFNRDLSCHVRLHSFRILLWRIKFCSVSFFPRASVDGTDSQQYVSPITKILTSSRLEFNVIFPAYPNAHHFLNFLTLIQQHTVTLYLERHLGFVLSDINIKYTDALSFFCVINVNSFKCA